MVEHPPTVFISYSHDSQGHADRVLALADRLRAEGVDVILDQYEFSPAEGWSLWMERCIRDSDFVLMICTQTYFRRVMGEEEVGKGLGVRWEGSLIRQYIYDTGQKTRFIPVFFEDGDSAHIPMPVKDGTQYRIYPEYEALYRRLTDQPAAIKPVLGELRHLPSRQPRQRQWTDHPLDQRENVPLYRPPRANHFTDREEALAQIMRDLQPGRTVTLCGPGGMGKTALAAEAVWQLAPANEPPRQFPDGIVFHSFYNQPDSNLALEAIARAFGEEPKPTPASAAQRALAGKRVLLVLDGTEDADDLPRVREVAGGCGLLVTSRDIRDAVDERQDLCPLVMVDAVQLLTDWAGEALDDDQAARRICELVGQLPLAIRLVGRYLWETGDRASEYLQWLEETPFEALDPDCEQHRLESVLWLLQRSLAQVDKPARDVLALAGQLALAPLDAAVIEEALRFSTGTRKRALRQLIGYGLLVHTGERYEVTHALVHTYARERLDVETEVFEQLVSYYTRLISEQSALGAPGYERLDAERNHILRLSKSCFEREAWREILELIKVTQKYFEYQGYWTERRITVEWGLEAARKLADHTQEANCVSALGEVHYRQDEYEPARQRFEQAQAIYETIGNRLGQANCMSDLGEVHRMQGDYEPARQRYEQALTIYEAIGNRLGQADCMRTLGHVHYMQDEYEPARQRYEQALTIYEAIGNRLGQANCIQSLGDVHRWQGEYESAYQRHEQALTIYEAIGNRLGQANCMRAQGDVHLMQGDYEPARQRYEQAQAIYEAIGNRYSYAWSWAYLGLIHKGMKEIDQARRCLEQAIAIFEEIHVPAIETARQWLDELDVQSSQ